MGNWRLTVSPVFSVQKKFRLPSETFKHDSLSNKCWKSSSTCIFDSKFWTRNRPGDTMKDKYNLNLLPAGLFEDTHDGKGCSRNCPGGVWTAIIWDPSPPPPPRWQCPICSAPTPTNNFALLISWAFYIMCTLYGQVDCADPPLLQDGNGFIQPTLRTVSGTSVMYCITLMALQIFSTNS